jgi:hypothetical protein
MTTKSDNNLSAERSTAMMNEADLAGVRSGWVRPAHILDGDAAGAWEAYNAMQTTKQRHYELLQIIDNKKKKFNIKPTSKDATLLSSLLADHDAQVKRFTLASSELKRSNVEAHRALFEYIGLINQFEPDGQSPH